MGAYRSTEVCLPDPLLALLADLGEASLAEETRLDRPLVPEEASALLQRILAEGANPDSTLHVFHHNVDHGMAQYFYQPL